MIEKGQIKFSGRGFGERREDIDKAKRMMKLKGEKKNLPKTSLLMYEKRMVKINRRLYLK